MYAAKHPDELLDIQEIAEKTGIGMQETVSAVLFLTGQEVPAATAEPQTRKEEEEGTRRTEKNAAAKGSGAFQPAFPDSEDFAEMLYILQQYLSKAFNQKDMESVAYMYDTLQMPRDLIEYLVEICVLKGKKSLKYIEAIAQDWHSRGIMTVEAAKKDGEIYAQETWGVMKAFGINDRKPGTEELRYIDTWFRVYGMPKELVEEACTRTLLSTHKPSFPYADSILKKWYKEEVRDLNDIKKLDAQHETKAAKETENRTGNVRPAVKNRFNNFDQRSDDLDEAALKKLKDVLG